MRTWEADIGELYIHRGIVSRWIDRAILHCVSANRNYVGAVNDPNRNSGGNLTNVTTVSCLHCGWGDFRRTKVNLHWDLARIYCWQFPCFIVGQILFMSLCCSAEWMQRLSANGRCAYECDECECVARAAKFACRCLVPSSLPGLLIRGLCGITYVNSNRARVNV